MAKIGLNNFRYAKVKQETATTITYDEAKKPGKAISCNVKLNKNEAELYADDGLAESDTSISNGDITMGVDEADKQTKADLLGHTV